jgi:CO/xanthine dehydrogenase FAD-binding subunit
MRSRWPRSAGALIEELEVALACAADGAEPVVRNIRELGARRYSAVRIALGGVVDEPARDADEALTGHRGAR